MTCCGSRKIKMERRSADPFLLCKKVCFASVHVREYPIILGDNPTCSSGPPVTLDWEYNGDASASRSVDEWENERYYDRRSREEMRVVPASVRTEWLLDAGFSPLQIHEVIQDIQKEQHRQRLSIDKSRLQDKAAIVAESMKRTLERAIGKRGKSDNPYKLCMLSQ